MKYPQPLADRVIILPDPIQEDKSLFKVREENQDKPSSGTVMAVGKGRYATESGVLIPNELEVGNKVLYNRFAGGVINVEGVEHLLIKESDIALIL